MQQYHWFHHEFGFPYLKWREWKGHALVYFAGRRNTLWAMEQADLIPVFV
jgi:hypothetical protein